MGKANALAQSHLARCRSVPKDRPNWRLSSQLPCISHSTDVTGPDASSPSSGRMRSITQTVEQRSTLEDHCEAEVSG